jgi:citrate lyase subunit beta/citryl-CoA lyase
MTSPAAPFRLRSLLFVPAHVDRFVARAHERGADGVILDLEDAVPAAEKPAARGKLAASVAGIQRNGTAALVRVNHGIRHLAQDLEAAVVSGLAALVLPKVEEPGFVREVAEAVAELEVERGLPPGGVRFVLQVETPGALFVLPAIAAAHPRILAMTLGPEDYSASVGGVPEADTLFTPNYAVLCAARAAGVIPLGFVGSIGDYADIGASPRRCGGPGGSASAGRSSCTRRRWPSSTRPSRPPRRNWTGRAASWMGTGRPVPRDAVPSSWTAGWWTPPWCAGPRRSWPWPVDRQER